MPSIAPYQQQTGASGSLSIRSPDIGAQTAQAVGNVAGALNGIAADKNAALREQEERSARSWSGPALTKANLDWTDNLQKRKESALPGAPDFTPGVMADFDAYSSKLIDSAPSVAAKDYVRQHMEALKNQIGQQSLAFEAQARVGLRIDNAQASIENASKVVQQDPSQYSKMLSIVRETMPEVGPEASKQLNDHLVQTMTNAAASQVMDADPYAVQEVTSKAMGHNGFSGKTGTPWVDDATPEQVKQWNNTATTKIRMIESEMARNTEVRTKAATDIFGAATDLSFKGQFFSEPFKAQLRSTVKGTQFEAATEELISSQSVTAGFASAPSSDRTAVLNDIRSRGADPKQGTTPEMAKQLEKINTIDGEIRKAVDDNPWVAAQRYGVTRDSSAVALKTPQDVGPLIQQRAQTQGQVEAWAGKPVSPLQPSEAAQFSSMLGAMPPPARAQVLGQVGAALPLGRVAALADQLDKTDKPQALALKLGADSTTAGRTVGELVLRGAQALKDKTVKRDDAALTGWRQEIAGLVRGTIGDERAENDIIDSAYYVRASLDNEGTAIPGFDLNASNRNAVRLVAGDLLERGNVKTFLPRGMTEETFDKALGQYTVDKMDLVAPGGVFVRGQPVPMQRFVDSLTRYGMRKDSQGNFLPSSGGSLVTTDKEGRIPLRLPVSP